MPSTTSRRWLGPALKLAILALVIWGGHRTISEAVEKLRRDGWTFEQIDFGWLVVCAGLYLIGQLPCGLFWRRILCDMGEEVPLGRALRAYYIGHLGKYVPGKAVVFVLRIGLIKAVQPLRTGVGVAAIFYETLTTMAVGAFMATVILALDRSHEWHVLLISAGLALNDGGPARADRIQFAIACVATRPRGRGDRRRSFASVAIRALLAGDRRRVDLDRDEPVGCRAVAGAERARVGAGTRPIHGRGRAGGRRRICVDGAGWTWSARDCSDGAWSSRSWETPPWRWRRRFC